MPCALFGAAASRRRLASGLAWVKRRSVTKSWTRAGRGHSMQPPGRSPRAQPSRRHAAAWSLGDIMGHLRCKVSAFPCTPPHTHTSTPSHTRAHHPCTPPTPSHAPYPSHHHACAHMSCAHLRPAVCLCMYNTACTVCTGAPVQVRLELALCHQRRHLLQPRRGLVPEHDTARNRQGQR